MKAGVFMRLPGTLGRNPLSRQYTICFDPWTNPGWWGVNDGWEQLELTDFAAFTIMIFRRKTLRHGIWISKKPCGAVLISSQFMPPGEQYNGVPVLITEMGGVKLVNDDGWGYNQAMSDEDDMLQYLRSVMRAVRSHRQIRGFCYTQLTDVQQETNGLLDAARNPRWLLKSCVKYLPEKAEVYSYEKCKKKMLIGMLVIVILLMLFPGCRNTQNPADGGSNGKKR